MTAPDYVAQAVAVIREFIVEAVGFDHGELMTAQAENLARNLAAAGLIPTSTEWGVATACVPGCPTAPHISSEDFGGCESTAREIVSDVERATLASRAVTDWKDATDD